jgi:hypothetical protein
MHYKLGHHPMGGKFFRNHINFHHTYYAKDHLVSPTYLSDEGHALRLRRAIVKTARRDRERIIAALP